MQNDSDPLQHSFNQLKPNGGAIGIEITGGYADTSKRYGRSSSGDHSYADSPRMHDVVTRGNVRGRSYTSCNERSHP